MYFRTALGQYENLVKRKVSELSCSESIMIRLAQSAGSGCGARRGRTRISSTDCTPCAGQGEEVPSFLDGRRGCYYEGAFREHRECIGKHWKTNVPWKCHKDVERMRVPFRRTKREQHCLVCGWLGSLRTQKGLYRHHVVRERVRPEFYFSETATGS